MKIIYEDKNLAVLDKPAGILVHPTEANEHNTIVDFIIDRFPVIKKYDWPDKTRPGIVHRLDKDTSGLILIAKNTDTQKFLQDQFKEHKIQKKYLALVLGKVEPKEGIIKTQISRDQKNRTTQKTTYFSYSWQKQKSRFAKTHYKVLQYFSSYKPALSKFEGLRATRYTTLLELQPKTGRMHQLRIHCQHLGYPIIGDQKYFTKESKKISQELNLSRQFLHAQKLEFKLPGGKIKIVESELPEDLKININKFKKE